MELDRRTAREAYNRWRGFSPWPGAHAEFRGKRFLVHRMHPATAERSSSSRPVSLLWSVTRCSRAPQTENWRSTKCRWRARRECPARSLRGTSSFVQESVLPKPRQGADARPQRARQTARVQQAKSISPARSAAFRVLMQVDTSSAHSDDLLHGEALRKLSQPDRNLATALVMGVLRWQIALDAELAKLLRPPRSTVA